VLLNAPGPSALKGKRDRAILALLISCALRRAELVGLEVDEIQQREGPWVIPDLVGKGNRLRTVTIPAAVKVRIDTWIAAAKIDKGKIFRPVNKATGWRANVTPAAMLATVRHDGAERRTSCK